MDVEQIRAKLGAGVLPTTDWDMTRLVGGGFGACVACDTPTTPHDVAVECHLGTTRMMLHPDCYVMWEEARRTAS